MRVAIIGAGLQCRRRAPVVRDWPGTELAVIAGHTAASAEKMARAMGAQASGDWQEVVNRNDLDLVLVCTPPHLHAPVSIAAMKAGKHVLCEKPLTRRLDEAEEMVKVARATRRVLKCGFNHRHHPGIWKAKQLLDQGSLGTPVFARCRYGITGRPGYEKEWRANPEMAAGGQLIEQGIHGMDLIRWFLGDITEAAGMTANRYFTLQPLEDNGMALFRASSGAIAMLHASLTQWKNLFSFEIFGQDGYARVEGLGSSYGTEQLVTGKRDFTAPFSETLTEYRGSDASWQEEWKEFVTAIQENREPLGNGEDGLEAMKMAVAAYESEKSGKIIRLKKL